MVLSLSGAERPIVQGWDGHHSQGLNHMFYRWFWVVDRKLFM